MPNLRNLAMELRKVCCHPVRITCQQAAWAAAQPGCMAPACQPPYFPHFLASPPKMVALTPSHYGPLLQYLCTGLEDDILRRKLEAASAAEAAGGAKVAALSEVDQLVQACGKMVLLHKLLPKLKAEGHKVGWVGVWGRGLPAA